MASNNTRQAVLAVFAALAVCVVFFSLLNETQLNNAYSYTVGDSGKQEVNTAVDDDNDPVPRTSNVPYNQIHNNEKYFVYSPTGGLSNQLIELAIALEICIMLNRTLIAPMIGKHTSGFRLHESLAPTDLFPMDRIIDFTLLQQKVNVIPLNTSVLKFIKTLEQNGEDVHTIYHQYRQVTSSSLPSFPNTQLTHTYIYVYRVGWVEAQIPEKMGIHHNKILYLRGQEMYHEWFPAAKTRDARLFVRFAPALRNLALQAVQQMFPRGDDDGAEKRNFNAMHIRLGDYTRRWPQSASSKSQAFVNKAFGPQVTDTKLPLYLASDEVQSSAFNELRKRVLVQSMRDVAVDLIKPYRELFPATQIRLDMLGVLDQLICAQANSFVSSEFSTFSEHIRFIRANRKSLFPEAFRATASDDNKEEEEVLIYEQT